MKLITTRLKSVADKTIMRLFYCNGTRPSSYQLCKNHDWSSKKRHPAELSAENKTKTRNIGILAHIDAGKTTTAERMLYYSGFSKHLGDVDDGDTVMDYMEEERERGITIQSAAITFHWKKHRINLIDTPGHVDFTVEVERCLRVLDGAVVILDSSAGVEAQTQTVWKQANRYAIPRIVYLNKMDKRGATIDKCLTSLKDKFKIDPLLLHLPLGCEHEFQGVIDLVTMEKLVWNRHNSPDGHKFRVLKMDPSDESIDFEEVLKARSDMIGLLSEFDRKLEEDILCDVKIEDISKETIFSAIRNATIKRQVVPVVCGTSLKNMGVQPLLDAVANYLPSPIDRKYEFADLYGEDLCALAFKIIHDQQRGPLTFLRLYSGSLKSGSTIYNINQDCSEKCSRIVQVNADEYKDVNIAASGNIVCLTGLKQTVTGDTITNSKTSANAAMKAYRKKHNDTELEEDDISGAVMAGLQIPTPVFFCSVEPPSISADKNLQLALECLQREDPSLKVEVNADTCQTIISGMGELHLEIIKHRIEREFKIDALFGEMQIAYRETITQSVTDEGHLDKVIGNKSQNVKLKLSVEPDDNCPVFKKVELVPARDEPIQINKHQLKAVNNGIKSALLSGNLLHYPIINVKVKLYEFEMTRRTSLPMVSACASHCINKIIKQAKPALLEPIMSLTILTKDDKLPVVLADLSRRRCHIQGIKEEDEEKCIEALAPLSDLLGFSTTLRTVTSGTASFCMELSHYEIMGTHEQNLAIQKHTGIMPL